LPTSIAKELEGAWEGSLNAGGTIRRLKLTLANRAEGGATGTMVSLDQGGAEIPIATVTQTASRLEFAVPMIGGSHRVLRTASYAGVLTAASPWRSRLAPSLLRSRRERGRRGRR
jgi:hypothetical protein